MKASEWYEADKILREVLCHAVSLRLTKKEFHHLAEASVTCRGRYINALNSEHGPEEADRILERQAREERVFRKSRPTCPAR